MQLHSPLTGSTNVVLEKEIKCRFIIDSYRKQLDVNVTKYFHDLESIQIYRCLDTGYRFYYPFDIDGDSKFYEALQKYKWYYMDWKWEHEIASMIIAPANKVLEIGCGRGGFLEKMQQKGVKGTGLELNESALESSRSKGLEVLNQTIQDHSVEHPAQYDVVCSFQVVEHIAAIKEFMQASVNVLKPGGKLIVSVPNNDSLIIKCYPDTALNMPPHHMGLWNMNSLIKIQRCFDLQVEAIHLEPVQPYHLWYSYSLVGKRLSREWRNRYGFIASLIPQIARPITSSSVKALAEYIIGHTVLAVYVKL